jgi:hypothetical protein
MFSSPSLPSFHSRQDHHRRSHGAEPAARLGVSLVREPDIVGIPNSQLRGMLQQDGTFALQNVGPGEYRVYIPPLIAPFQWHA